MLLNSIIFWVILWFLISTWLKLLLLIGRFHIKCWKWSILFFTVCFRIAFIIIRCQFGYQHAQIIFFFYKFWFIFHRLLIQSARCENLLLIIVIIHFRLRLLVYDRLLYLFLFRYFRFLKFTHFFISLLVFCYWWSSFYCSLWQFWLRFNFFLLIDIF